jgi:tetratricopeptide (TPR) repeat protein
MTEAWRLTVGDDFFSDKFTGALRAATMINALVFRIYPGITLLGFRELQFILTIISLLFLSFALYRINKDFWFQPLIFSVFAFTGLDPMGAISNLSYYTYPHLFITLHLAFFIMGLQQQSVLLRRILYVTSGVFLWLISFSLLHMSMAVISVMVLFIIIRRFKIEVLDFNFKDMCFVLAPVLLLWIIFLGIYGNSFIRNVIASLQVIFSPSNPLVNSLIYINLEVLKYTIITLLFTIAFLWSTKISKTALLVAVLSILAILMFTVIDTTFFGLITTYHRGWYNGWYNRPMWFSALLASSYFLFLCYFIFKIVKKTPWNNFELFALIVFIPGIITAIDGSMFSGVGIGAILGSSIPAVAAMTCIILSLETVKKRVYLVQFIILILFIAPFYYSTAWTDWKFLFFDVAPEQANAEIETGFGKGIKTNQIYKNLYDWISKTSQAYSNKDDYIISYVASPMVYIIARRRPALDESHISFAEFPEDYYHKAMEFMKTRGRKPKLVYVFEAMPALYTINLEEPLRVWQGKQFSFPSGDPISQYVLANMTLIDSFPITQALSVRCFLDNSSVLRVLENKLNNDPADPNLNLFMGNFYQRRGNFNKAERYYHKALDINPKFIPALMHLAINQSLKGNDPEALNLLKKVVAIDPNRIDSYYNIACIYARRKQINDSILWLTKAVDKGFNDGELLQADHDFDNIKNTKNYKAILNKLQEAHVRD